MSLSIMFDVSTHSRPKAAGILLIVVIAILKAFQLTAARRRLGTNSVAVKSPPIVSTHSRPKAAGCDTPRRGVNRRCFNSQPPEGGWNRLKALRIPRCGFNSQPPEGGWILLIVVIATLKAFQLTAARRRLDRCKAIIRRHSLFQLTAARRRLVPTSLRPRHSLGRFNSQPPEGGWLLR